MRVRRFFSSNRAEPDGYCEACEDPEHPDDKRPVATITIGPLWNCKYIRLCEACLEELESCAHFARMKFGGAPVKTTPFTRAELRTFIKGAGLLEAHVAALLDDFDEVAKQLEDARDQLQKMTIELGSIRGQMPGGDL